MNDARYFKHDDNARNDLKITQIRQKYGLKGYGIFFCLIELLRSSKCYELNYDIKSLVYDLREDEESIKDIVENFGLFVVKEDKFYSESLKNRMNELDKIRKKRKKAGLSGASVRWEKTKKKKIVGWTREEAKALKLQ